MKVLLLHSDDTFPPTGLSERWDLIVDFARAPAARLDNWRQQAGCPIFSLYQFAEEIEDLDRVRRLLQLGTRYMLDQWGIDWWEVVSVEIVPQLWQFMLVHRLSQQLDANCQLYSSRPHALAAALARILGARLTISETGVESVIQLASHYYDAFSQLDIVQLGQVLQDKFDCDHSIRRLFARRGHASRRPVILLPSAYINVSRAALSYAELLRDRQFLLVHTRGNAQVTSLPANVQSRSLSPYFIPRDQKDTASLLESWNILRKQLVDGAEEFSTAYAVGVLGRIPALLRWGLALRDAWSQVFESENVTACFCADDSNPPSNIPLIIAKKRGVPALACHHGALDYMAAIKANQADFNLVKSEMESDYLTRVCHLAPEKIVIAPPVSSKPLPLQPASRCSAPWLVFFTEPYQSYGWRSDEVYRDLLPRLCSLARTCGLRLVFKLHPFESIKGHRKMLRRLIPEHARQIEVLAGPPSEQLWNNTRFGVTVQSSTALECSALGIPVFICAWLRDPYSGYVRQYARFGVGHLMDSPEQIAEIPALLEMQSGKSFPQAQNVMDSEAFAQLLAGTYSLPVASSA